MNPNAFIWIQSAPLDKIARRDYSQENNFFEFMRATDPDIMDEHKVNTSRKWSPPNPT
jgi:hypothetical protein